MTVFRVILAILTAYRATILVTHDEWPFALMARLRDLLTGRAAKSAYGSKEWTLAVLVTCPMCMGLWVSFFVTLLFFRLSFGDFILTWLSIAGAQAVLTKIVYREET